MSMKLLLTLCLLSLLRAQYFESISSNLYYMDVISYCNPASVAKWSCPLCKDSPFKIADYAGFKNSSGHFLGYIAYIPS